MSDQDNIFETDKKTEDQPVDKVDNPLNDLLKGIVNENGEQKYKTVADALVGLKNAQEFIPTLQREKRELESKFSDLESKVGKIDELEATLLELSNRRKETSEETPRKTETPESITKQVEAILEAREAKTTFQKNLKTVVEAVKEKFGEKAQEVFYEKAKELGMSNEEFNELAAKHPQVCLRALDISGDDAHRQSNSVSPFSSSLNSAGIKPSEEPIYTKPERGIMNGASTQDVLNEVAEAGKMVERLEAKGLSIDDLSKPSNYFKVFGT